MWLTFGALFVSMMRHVCNFSISTRDEVITTCLLFGDVFGGGREGEVGK